jgi:[acyl-carrier-protein] S-malonyltransferase
MSTAFVFGPLSSMLRPEDRCRYRHLEEVQARFTSAAAILGNSRGLQICFDELIDKPSAELCARAHLNFAAALVIAIQLGVVDRLQMLLPQPAWMAGVSLGDVARTVSAGVCSFELALHVTTLGLAEVERADQVGATVVVMTTSRHPFTTEDFTWFDSADLAVSQLSDRFLNVAGLDSGLQLLQDRAQRCRWKIFPLLDFPLHSRHAACHTAMAQELVGRLPLGTPAPGIRVYSSVLQKEIEQPDDFRQEFLGSIVHPYNWKATVNDLVENHGVSRFVNIGPCRSLSILLEEMGQDVLEADELIGRSMPQKGAERFTKSLCEK